MLTRCPQPTCLKEFEAEAPDHPVDCRWKRGKCPNCGQPLSFRPIELIYQLERLAQKRPEPLLPEKLPSFSVALEDIRSLWNVGSIFRTSDAAGVEMLFLCGITGCPPRKEIAKTSLGAQDSIPWQFHTNVLSVLPELKRRSMLILGLERTPTSQPLTRAVSRGALSKPLCLLLGNEVTGLSQEALSCCDLVCHLPMRGVKESLNVAVAFGIAAYSIAEALDDARQNLRINS